ncbi:Uncharacterized protein CK203_032109 [Vitis vinifera]|uniref:Leucine-rich repeat-containing N-terminal plant-type domain-containing protein n=1 Tax=Vitis vinifera TaxID=29760 RepID=A0A438FNB5_VITVI|nr:Uncharacterized protein CK203_032109 [Vitis vinifera]
MGRNTISFCSIFLIWALFLDWGLLRRYVAADDGGVVKREGFEIIIGGGYSPPPEYEEGCPPPPPPPEPECPPPSPPPPPPPPLPLHPSSTPSSTPSSSSSSTSSSSSPPPPPPPPPPVDRNARLKIALKAIRIFQAKITVDPFNIAKGWKGNNPCTFKGFVCSTVPDKNLNAVAGVDFNGFNFGGPNLALDGFLNGLPDITIFHANSNDFNGRIPKIDTTKLRYLYELDLSNNKLHGDTPALYLTFANNKFTGPIPRSIGRSKNLLEVLFLNNQLSGCLPYEIGHLKDATVFDVGFNQLTGPIPHSFGCLDSIQILNLAANQFYGPVPETLCELPNLYNLSLSHNYFTQQKPEHACSHFFSKSGNALIPSHLSKSLAVGTQAIFLHPQAPRSANLWFIPHRL